MICAHQHARARTQYTETHKYARTYELPMCKSDVPITRHHVDMIGELPTSSHSCSLTRTSRWIHHSNKDQLGDPPKRLSPRERGRGGNKWKDRALSHRFLHSSVERSRSEPSSVTELALNKPSSFLSRHCLLLLLHQRSAVALGVLLVTTDCTTGGVALNNPSHYANLPPPLNRSDDPQNTTIR